MTESENRMHVVYNKDTPEMASVYQTYADAHAMWERHHTYDDPWLIATLGRVIDPSTPVIDVNE